MCALAPSASPPSPAQQPLFRTQSTAFAASIVAADLLRYVRTERAGPRGAAVFVFEDPRGEGDELSRRFNAGMFPRVEPKMLFSARGFLTEEMARVAGRRRHAS
jgi:hypothetical protein